MFVISRYVELVFVFSIVCSVTCISPESTISTNITLGVILGDIGTNMNYVRFIPVIEIAIENIHAEVDAGNLLPMHMTFHLAVTDKDCGGTVMTAPGVASTLYQTYKPDALFGPNCSPEAAPVADLAAYWNIPMLTGSTTAHYLDNKVRYRTFTRLPFKQSTLARFVMQTLKVNDWSAVSVIMEDYIYWTFVANAILHQLYLNDVDVQYVYLSASKSERGVIDELMNRRSKFLPLCLSFQFVI